MLFMSIENVPYFLKEIQLAKTHKSTTKDNGVFFFFSCLFHFCSIIISTQHSALAVVGDVCFEGKEGRRERVCLGRSKGKWKGRKT